MAWTYDPADLVTTPLYQVRFLIGDTDTNDQLLQDDEISFAIIRRTSVNGAAAMCAGSIAAKFSRLADTTVGPESVRLSQKAAQFRALAADLEGKDDSTGGAFPFVGGTSIGNKQGYESDTDRVKPSFTKTMTDYPVAGGQAPTNMEDIPYWGIW